MVFPETVSVDTLSQEKVKPPFSINNIVIEKELAYDQYTLEDSYPYKDTTRQFQWDKIRQELFFIDSIQRKPSFWGVLQNYRNGNGEGSLVRNWHRNVYGRVSDQYEVERWQSVPLFLKQDRDTAERYGRDGSLVKIIRQDSTHTLVSTVSFEGEWWVANKYVTSIGHSDSISFNHVVVVDRENQNISTLEKTDSIWYVRSMNPATTGQHNPPYGHETPLGLFVVQEQKPKMLYLKDGTSQLGGFAPHASRFTNGAYIHGVPVNAPRTQPIEYSATLGTTPRSHMCVRNATSHAKFIYDWVELMQSLVVVIE